MDNIEHDVKVLNRLLNSELFLGKYPIIKRVWVEGYGNKKISIILSVKEPYSEYSPFEDEIKSYILNIAKMAGVKPNFVIYP